MTNLEIKQLFYQLKNNNGVVEVEASDNDDVIETHKKQLEENKNFSNVFMKEIDQKKSDKIKNNDNISYLGSKKFKNSEFKSR